MAVTVLENFTSAYLPETIIPKPDLIKMNEGQLQLGPNVSIVAVSNKGKIPANLLLEYLNTAGFNAQIVNSVKKQTSANSVISLNALNEPHYDKAGFCTEEYQIDINKHAVEIKAKNREGLCRAVQTFRQLLPPKLLEKTAEISPFLPEVSVPPIVNPVVLQCCTIKDKSFVRWRGVHLDVSRHFFPPKDIARFIDLAAFHKFNRVHLHLTDDQGWRFEVKKYPKLTEIGAYRNQTLIGHHNDTPWVFDNTVHGGYYTQFDLRQLVTFAQNRAIEIIPEIDMPGHMQAAIAAYPEWGCTNEQLSVREIWGISNHILNVEPKTINAMKEILGEIADVFPSKFIHIGGDEAPKHQWKESSQIQQRMKEYGCQSEEDLQGWVVVRMSEYLQTIGRRAIGWDEILEGNISEGTAVMSWRGENGGIKAAQLGREVVMAPEEYTYFDHYQDEAEKDFVLAIGGHTPLEKVYAYKTIPEQLSNTAAKHILGAQAQHWTEYITSAERLDTAAFPRLCAFCEVVWASEENKDYQRFLERLLTHRKRLDALRVKSYPKP